MTNFPKLFSGTNLFRYRFQDFFPVPNFSDTSFTDTGTHYKFSKFLNKNQFWYQIFRIPAPRLFPVPNLFRYRFRYHQEKGKFLVQVHHTLVIMKPSLGKKSFNTNPSNRIRKRCFVGLAMYIMVVAWVHKGEDKCCCQNLWPSKAWDHHELPRWSFIHAFKDGQIYL